MGMFKRLGTLIKSNINDLISRAENPLKILNQLILDMQDSLQEARKYAAVAIADEKRLRKKLDKELEKAKEWEKRAMMAVRAGRDDLAKEALVRKTEHDDMAASYRQQWESQKNATEKLKYTLRLLERKISEAKRKKELLAARMAQAEAQKKMAEALGNLAEDDVLSRYGEMVERVEKMEAEAEAATELVMDDHTSRLENKFADLESEHQADDALASLKAKMGMVEAADAPAEAPAEDVDYDLDQLDFEELEKAVAVANKRAAEEDK